MMKRIYAYCLLAAAAFSLQSCLDMDMAGLYDGDLHSLEIRLSPPGDVGDIVFDGAVVRLREINSDADYTAACDDRGVARISLPNGIYMASTSLTGGEYRYGGSVSGIIVGGSDASCSIALARTRVSDIVIKEIYCGGCMKYPQEGTYQTDSYFILHNNSANTVYLDGLCFGTLDPYNSNSAPVWGTDPGFVPIIQAIWQFPGEGSDFPLGAGEDAVVAVFGAIDHSAYYPMSVDLNREDVFVCYNPTYFPNAMWHPAPGDKVSPDRYLSVVIKTGQANAYTFSVSSPALVIFRAEGETIQEFVSRSENVVQKPGSSRDRVVCLPPEWVLDGVEVFTGESSSNKKRLDASIDASYVTLSKTCEGHSLMRRVDEEASLAAGREILVDTNDSLEDFYESETQSLHK